MITALVHSQGIVVDKKFYALEIAYIDVTGYRRVFLVNSPFTFHDIRYMYPKLRIHVLMTRYDGTSYGDVVKFLKQRYEHLSQQFPNTSIVFGHKGESYQKNVLESARVPRINIEKYGVPSLSELENMFPEITVSCPNHVGIYKNKCAYRCTLLLEAVSKSLESNSFSFSKDTTFS